VKKPLKSLALPDKCLIFAVVMTAMNRIIFVTSVLLSFLLLMSCGGERRARFRASKADSIMFAAGETRDYARILVLADSLESVGDLPTGNANRWRGVAYYYQGQLRTSEFYYQKAINAEIKTENDALSYNKSARRLANVMLKKGDYEGALHVAMNALEKMRENQSGTDTDEAMLTNTVGCCLLNLGRTEQAAKIFNKANVLFHQMTASDSTGHKVKVAYEGVSSIADEYLRARHYAEALPWIDYTDELAKSYKQQPTADAQVAENAFAKINLMRAIALENIGQSKEAAKVFRAAAGTSYGKSGEGRLYANDYLMASRRYSEAADNFRDLDHQLSQNGITLTLDNIQQYLLPKYRANVGAQRKDSAIAVGTQISNALDSAISIAKRNDAAELATMYDTHQKEAEIAQHKESLTHQRLIYTGVALVLVMTFFIIYTLHKREATHRLSIAHEKLQHAYDKLEETTAAKERIESELRIARDIQMSMVPNIFPDREGLDLYASIAPAKEVGGDLYGYLLLGDQLYFCLGDVSGKGVPASLFMAQATRLFRTLATQHMMPAEIATRMNDALTEDNEQGMFVTMFIGLADLNRGKLDFCNAGHNPPIIHDGTEPHFMDMLTNAPIGLWPNLEFDGETFEDIRGLKLFLYTDGLNEAEDHQKLQFGDDCIIEIISHCGPTATSKDVVDMLRDAVEQHRNGAEPNDDLTMMCMEIQKTATDN
jgi:serine phosphatase RsbU (regulator of sigma subunit)